MTVGVDLKIEEELTDHMKTDSSLLWIWLSIAFSPANKRLWDVLSYYDDMSEMCADLMNRQCGYVTHKESEQIAYCSLSQAEEIERYCHKRGIYIMTRDDPLYPERLKNIDCPPVVLFCRGDLQCLSQKKSVAVVGSREASNYSLAVAQEFSAYLACQGVTVISGFAVGIDTAAHTAAMNTGGKTVAVLGCGIEYDYPKNTMGFRKSVSSHGAVISEYFPQAKPVPENFKVRNRIVSALSDGVLVVQAGTKSGTLNTVNHAMSQGKEVFVIPPHDILCTDYAGQSALLRDGATAVYAPHDILYYLK